MPTKIEEKKQIIRGKAAFVGDSQRLMWVSNNNKWQ